MQTSEVIRKLRYFPQDSEVTASDYGLYVYLFGYSDTFKSEDGIEYQACPSYDLVMITDEELEKLPWLKDHSWFKNHKL